jgi:hypothetical protein
MLPFKFKYGDTVYFLHENQIQSSKVVATGRDKEQFKDSEGNLIESLHTNNFYIIKGYPGDRFYESSLSDSPEKFL